MENRTAIHVACANGSADVLKVLLEYKASTEIPVSYGALIADDKPKSPV